MSAAWVHYHPAGPVPDNSLAFFGANCIHTPQMEGQDERACPRCGGVNVFGEPNRGEADPVHVFDNCITEFGEPMLVPLDLSCGVCGRSLYDNTRAINFATKPDNGCIRPGYETLDSSDTDKADKHDATGAAVAAKVQGRQGTDWRAFEKRERQLMKGVKKP
jgi:hypothetical protein